MKSVEAQGFNREEALKTTGLDVTLDRLTNATLAWKKAGSPLNTKQLNTFMQGYIKKKKVLGAYIVVDASSSDTRKRPYTIINETTHGKRKTTMFYQVKEAELDVKYRDAQKTVVDKETGEEKVIEFQSPYVTKTIEVEVTNKETGEKSLVEKEVQVPTVKVLSLGAVENKASKKDEALAIMKDLIEANKKDYVIEIVKEVTGGQKYAGYGVYTPSKSAKLGKFMFFVEEL
jgi:hypothetical protein